MRLQVRNSGARRCSKAAIPLRGVGQGEVDWDAFFGTLRGTDLVTSIRLLRVAHRVEEAHHDAPAEEG